MSPQYEKLIIIACVKVGMGGTQNFVYGIYREKYRGTGYTAVLVLW